MTKRRKKLRGAVQKIIKSSSPSEPEKAQVVINDADHLYREIRIENTLSDENGETRPLKRGEEVAIIVEADSDATLVKPE